MNAPDVARAWNERYSEPGLSFGDRPNDYLLSQEERIRNGGRKGLCIGEGEGRNAIWLAQLGMAVTAVDLSDVGLGKLRNRAAQLGLAIEAVQADLSEFAVEAGAWDLVVSVFCHLPSRVRVGLYPRLVAGLASGGLFVMESYTPSQVLRGTGGPSDPDMMLTAEQIRRELSGLHVLELQEVSREVVEGTRHTGLADVVQFVGQKVVATS